MIGVERLRRWLTRSAIARRFLSATLAVIILGVVSAHGSLALSAASVSVAANAFGTDTLEPPTDVVADGSNPGHVDLTWTPTLDVYADGYDVYRSDISGSGYAYLGTVADQSSGAFTDTLAPTESTHYYVVESYFENWTSASSEEATAAVSSYEDVIVATSGLVSYWRLGVATTSMTAPDSFGSNDGTPTSGVTLQVAGAIVNNSDTAASFDGTSGSIDVGNDSSLQLDTASVELWLKTADAGTGFRDLVAKTEAVYISLVDNVLGIYDENTGEFRSTGVSLDDDAWHHVVVTYQSGSTNGTKVYIDGALALTTTMTVVAHTETIWIGATAWTGGIEYYTGTIDEVAFYSVLLTGATVLDHYEAGTGP